MYVCYHGLIGIGPYCGKPTAPAKRSSKRKKPDDDDPGASDKGDPETERLINTINNH